MATPLDALLNPRGSSAVDALANASPNPAAVDTLAGTYPAVNPATPDTQEWPTYHGGEVAKGVQRGLRQMYGTSLATLGQFAEPFSSQASEHYFNEARQQLDIPSELRAKVGSLSDIHDVGSAMQYGAGALGEFIPPTAAFLGAGALGAGAGLGLRAAGMRAMAPSTLGGIAGGATFAPPSMGSTALTMQEDPAAMANTSPAQRLALSGGAGLVGAGLMAAPQISALGRAVQAPALRAGFGHALGEVGSEAARTAGFLGGAAGGTTAAEQYAHTLANPNRDKSKDWEQIKESALSGAVAGGVLGAGGGLSRAVHANIMRGRDEVAKYTPNTFGALKDLALDPTNPDKQSELGFASYVDAERAAKALGRLREKFAKSVNGDVRASFQWSDAKDKDLTTLQFSLDPEHPFQKLSEVDQKQAVGILYALREAPQNFRDKKGNITELGQEAYEHLKTIFGVEPRQVIETYLQKPGKEDVAHLGQTEERPPTISPEPQRATPELQGDESWGAAKETPEQFDREGEKKDLFPQMDLPVPSDVLWRATQNRRFFRPETEKGKSQTHVMLQLTDPTGKLSPAEILQMAQTRDDVAKGQITTRPFTPEEITGHVRGDTAELPVNPMSLSQELSARYGDQLGNLRPGQTGMSGSRKGDIFMSGLTTLMNNGVELTDAQGVTHHLDVGMAGNMPKNLLIHRKTGQPDYTLEQYQKDNKGGFTPRSAEALTTERNVALQYEKLSGDPAAWAKELADEQKALKKGVDPLRKKSLNRLGFARDKLIEEYAAQGMPHDEAVAKATRDVHTNILDSNLRSTVSDGMTDISRDLESTVIDRINHEPGNTADLVEDLQRYITSDGADIQPSVKKLFRDNNIRMFSKDVLTDPALRDKNGMRPQDYTLKQLEYLRQRALKSQDDGILGRNDFADKYDLDAETKNVPGVGNVKWNPNDFEQPVKPWSGAFAREVTPEQKQRILRDFVETKKLLKTYGKWRVEGEKKVGFFKTKEEAQAFIDALPDKEPFVLVNEQGKSFTLDDAKKVWTKWDAPYSGRDTELSAGTLSIINPETGEVLSLAGRTFTGLPPEQAVNHLDGLAKALPDKAAAKVVDGTPMITKAMPVPKDIAELGKEVSPEAVRQAYKGKRTPLSYAALEKSLKVAEEKTYDEGVAATPSEGTKAVEPPLRSKAGDVLAAEATQRALETRGVTDEFGNRVTMQHPHQAQPDLSMYPNAPKETSKLPVGPQQRYTEPPTAAPDKFARPGEKRAEALAAEGALETPSDADLRAAQSSVVRSRREAAEERAAIQGEPPTPEAKPAAPTRELPMNYKDGTQGMAMRPEFKGKSTLELIQSGDRTATTRMTKPEVKIGEVLRAKDREGNAVDIRVTSEPYKVSSITPEEWSKREGWGPENYNKYKNAWQFQYERAEKPVTDLATERDRRTGAGSPAAMQAAENQAALFRFEHGDLRKMSDAEFTAAYESPATKQLPPEMQAAIQRELQRRERMQEALGRKNQEVGPVISGMEAANEAPKGPVPLGELAKASIEKTIKYIEGLPGDPTTKKLFIEALDNFSRGIKNDNNARDLGFNMAQFSNELRNQYIRNPKQADRILTRIADLLTSGIAGTEEAAGLSPQQIREFFRAKVLEKPSETSKKLSVVKATREEAAKPEAPAAKPWEPKGNEYKLGAINDALENHPTLKAETEKFGGDQPVTVQSVAAHINKEFTHDFDANKGKEATLVHLNRLSDEEKKAPDIAKALDADPNAIRVMTPDGVYRTNIAKRNTASMAGQEYTAQFDSTGRYLMLKRESEAPATKRVQDKTAPTQEELYGKGIDDSGTFSQETKKDTHAILTEITRKRLLGDIESLKKELEKEKAMGFRDGLSRTRDSLAEVQAQYEKAWGKVPGSSIEPPTLEKSGEITKSNTPVPKKSEPSHAALTPESEKSPGTLSGKSAETPKESAPEVTKVSEPVNEPKAGATKMAGPDTPEGKEIFDGIAKKLGTVFGGKAALRWGKPSEEELKSARTISEGRGWYVGRKELNEFKATEAEIQKVRDERRAAQAKNDQAGMDAANAREKELLKQNEVVGTIYLNPRLANREMLPTAYHEMLHGAFDILLSPEERAILATAFSKGTARGALERIFKDDPEALAQIKGDAEEAAAYGFQIHAVSPEMLQLGPKATTVFGKIKEFFRKAFGLLTNEEKANLIMNDILSGRRQETGLSPLQRKLDKDMAFNERVGKHATAVGQAVTGLWHHFLTGDYDRLAKLGNPALQEIADRGATKTGSDEAAGFIHRYRNEQTARLNVLGKMSRKYSLDELKAARDAIMSETGGQGMAAYEDMRKFLGDFHKYARDAGVDIGYVKNYWPMLWDAEKVMQGRDAFIQMISQQKYAEQLDKLKVTPTELWENISGYVTRGESFQNVVGKSGEPANAYAKERSLSFLDPNDRKAFMDDNPLHALVHYTDQMTRQAEYVRAFGEGGKEFDRLLGEAEHKYGATKAQLGLAKDYLDGLLGNREVGMNRELKDLYGTMMVYQNYRLLPFNLFSSLVDPLGVAIRSNRLGDALETFTYSAKNLFRDLKKDRPDWTKDDWEKLSEDWGFIQDAGTMENLRHMTETMELRGFNRTMNDALFKYNLLNGWTRSNRIMAVKAAQRFFQRSAEGDREIDARNLKEVGLNKTDIVLDRNGRMLQRKEDMISHGVSEKDAAEIEDRLRQATTKFVDQSILNPSAADLPNWGSNPYFAPIFHLKQYMFSFQSVIIDRIMKEALEHGNYKPLWTASIYIPGMIAADVMKGMILNMGSLPAYQQNWGTMDYFGHGLDRSGLTGTAQMLLSMKDDMMHGGRGYESAVGPTVEQFTQLLHAATVGKNPSMFQVVDKAIPGHQLWDHWAVKPDHAAPQGGGMNPAWGLADDAVALALRSG